MAGLVKLLRDLANLHVGRRGVHRWQKWRERTWCSYCGLEAR
jgi:hypothetical protein